MRPCNNRIHPRSFKGYCVHGKDESGKDSADGEQKDLKHEPSPPSGLPQSKILSCSAAGLDIDSLSGGRPGIPVGFHLSDQAPSSTAQLGHISSETHWRRFLVEAHWLNGRPEEWKEPSPSALPARSLGVDAASEDKTRVPVEDKVLLQEGCHSCQTAQKKQQLSKVSEETNSPCPRCPKCKSVTVKIFKKRTLENPTELKTVLSPPSSKPPARIRFPSLKFKVLFGPLILSKLLQLGQV
ncbi:uncharacterized protein LOC114658659 [Erpetoichthys calabaricus]|uniref:uncharacterized protein LOC114658659 n=1 Tax=Erpetoichthys calabaricus TaxID=27687 RepID=UPI0022349B56|nr:uncharacterized protein LOC114658659 [Erpetoichthys calabaricus]